mmetsp:Transcript_53703/g.138847  ORF Transcript_53703/g.138847 Transcript_53703/m.138847 type:complete len:200 (+) Transcript_53703:2678-3277(+)
MLATSLVVNPDRGRDDRNHGIRRKGWRRRYHWRRGRWRRKRCWWQRRQMWCRWQVDTPNIKHATITAIVTPRAIHRRLVANSIAGPIENASGRLAVFQAHDLVAVRRIVWITRNVQPRRLERRIGWRRRRKWRQRWSGRIGDPTIATVTAISPLKASAILSSDASVVAQSVLDERSVRNESVPSFQDSQARIRAQERAT